MKLIKQRQRGDCVVASVATLAQRPWAEVKQFIGDTRLGCDRTQTRHLLDSFCGDHVYSTPHRDYTQHSWAASHPRDRALLIIRSDTEKFDHAVVAIRGQIHDPLPEPFGPSRVLEVYRLTGAP